MSPAVRAEGRRLLAEALGTASLLAAIVGSGIVVSGGGDLPAQLFQHAIVVGGALTALILAFGPVSGAHFNPVVTLADAWFGGMPARRAAGYVAAQLVGAVGGTVFTSLTFDLPAVAVATTQRPGLALLVAEAAATAGLLVVIFGLVRSGGGRVVAGAVGIYIAAAIVFTSSDAFANPAVTLGRVLTDTWTGIAPSSVPAFLAGQGLGLLAGIVLVALLYAPPAEEATRVVVPAFDDRPPPPSPAPDASPTRRTAAPDTTTTGAPPMSDTADVPTVLFLCVHNAGRSQMAAGWLRALAGDRVEVLSGGSEPAEQVNPAAVDAMREVGVDLTAQQPRRWRDADLEAADVVVTMGCGDTCPVLPGRRYLDWPLDDPAGMGVDGVRPVRDEIGRRVRELLEELRVEPAEERVSPRPAGGASTSG